MPRADLSAMLGRLDDPTSPPTPAPAPVERAATKSEHARTPTKKMSSTEPPAPTPSGGGGGYRSFERKEARLRADQYSRLTERSRQLNRAKGTGGERITENTLIRVAIDLLLSHEEQLNGATEEEIRNSVTL